MTYVWMWLVTIVTVATMVTPRPTQHAWDNEDTNTKTVLVTPGVHGAIGPMHPKKDVIDRLGEHAVKLISETQGAAGFHAHQKCYFKVCPLSSQGEVVHGHLY